MENEDYSKMPVEFITNKIAELVFKESTTENNGLESSESQIHPNEEFEKNEIVEEIIGETLGIEFATQKENIELTNEEKDVGLSNEKEELNIGNEKDGEEFNAGSKKEIEELNSGKEDGELSDEIENAEATYQNDVGFSNEKEDAEPIYEKSKAEITIEKDDARPNCDKDYTETESSDIYQESREMKDNLLKQDTLHHMEEKKFSNMKKAESGKVYTVICAECGSDSKISTTSTEKGSSSYSGSKSGIRIADPNSNEPFKVPNTALVAKIVRQAELYFSDFNILKNNFLLKHVRRNKEGYVSLKLVASFRKIKSMTKDWRVVAYSLETSKLLEVNPERSKIRRIEPIPKIEETSLGKTVIVFNLPFQNPTSRDLRELFSKFGNIVHAEIMSPKSENYNTYHKRCRFHNQEIETIVFGSIEFEKFEDAMSAIKDEESHLPKENKMNVVALIPQIERTRRRNPRFNQYNQYPRRGSGRFIPRYEFKNDQRMKSMPFDDYRYARPPMNEKPFRRFYRGGFQKSVHPSSSTSEIPDNYVANGEDVRSSSYSRNRQLKLNNQMNINRQFVTHPMRYVPGNFAYRET